jgi:8-oxo-dGTP pyrophosphatase MutT (NUDIX family)
LTAPSAAHAAACATLREYTPVDEYQRGLRADYLRTLSEHEDALDRSCLPDHLTASAIVLSADGREVLLHLHGLVNRWLQFGGHIESDDADLAAAALRESVEESGVSDQRLWSMQPVRLDRHDAPCAPGAARHHLDVQFVAVTRGHPQPQASAESHEVRWFDVDDLPTSTDDSVRILVRDAVAALLSAARPSATHQ